MALTADQITAKNFKEFYDKIFPYLNGGLARYNYSTDEQVVGTWIDGKPLYQKTVDCGALPNNATKEVDHNISNLERVININGYAMASNISNGYVTLPLVMANNVGSQIMLLANATKIRIGTKTDQTAYTESYVTLQYTKTTD